MKKMTRAIALLLALVIAAMLCSCGKGESAASQDLDGATLSIVIPSHGSWPYEESWKSWQYAREGSGVDLQVQAIPATDYMSKLPLMFASPDSLPDLMAFTYKPDTDVYASQGALIPIDDYADIMPNYTSFMDSLPKEKRDTVLMQRTASDGKLYYPPVFGTERTQNVRAWLYRKDIFEKHNISVPDTMDDLYNVCKELKKLYPDSYPFSMRAGFNNINVIGSSWKPYFCWNLYYDFDNNKWCYGATEDTMLEIAKFLNKMVSEKLLPADFLTINANTWQELVNTDKGFIFPDYQTRIDFFNPLGSQNNPSFDLTVCLPPKANTPSGQHMMNNYAVDPNGLAVCNTGKKDRIEIAIKYLDWMYSDEACELLSWGREGETYEVKDGKRVYIRDEAGNSPKSLYGFMTYGNHQRTYTEALESMDSEKLRSTTDLCFEHTMKNANPVIYLGFNSEEDAVKGEIGTAVETFVQEQLSKFILGQKPFSEWDTFQKELDSLGVNKLLAVYESAFERVKK